MKIGILTYHRAHNFGAMLQAYALKTYSKSLGYDIEFIDYNPKWKKYPMRTCLQILRFIKAKIKFLLYFPFIFSRKNKRKMIFNNFIDTYLEPINKDYKNTEYDLVIYGSDQIWWRIYNRYDEVFFGNDEIKAKRKITYSASMGNVNHDGETKLFLSKMLNNFNAVSVRESFLHDMCQPLTDKKVYHTSDPVFLLDKERWNEFSAPREIKNDYILFYNLQLDPTTLGIAGRLSIKMGLPVITISEHFRLFKDRENERNLISPNEFVSLIRHAKAVVSSSFHGVAFSIIMEKDFYVSLQFNNERVMSLLKITGLEERFITDISNLDTSSHINYNSVNEKLYKYQEESRNYLSSEIS